MRRLEPLAVNDQEIFDAVAAAKRQPTRGRMQAARAGVLSAYADYLANAPAFTLLANSGLTDEQKTAMRHAFTVGTQPMNNMRTSLLNRTEAARCPLCGISESSTLDHYLPKETYPAFSIFSPNLVPCCAWCNTKKRDKVLEQGTDARTFLHPYFDSIPDSRFLNAEASIQNGALLLKFSLVKPQGLGTAAFNHLSTHFRELGLRDRYRAMSLEHLGGQYGSLRRIYGADENPDRVSEELIHRSEDLRAQYGPNFWLATLYEVLAEYEEFCDGGFAVIRP